MVRSDQLREGVYTNQYCIERNHVSINLVWDHAKIALDEWPFVIYTFVRFNTNIPNSPPNSASRTKTLHRRVERFGEALNAPSIELCGPVEIDELYVSAGLKGHERDGPSRSRCLSTRGRRIHGGDSRLCSPLLIAAAGSDT